MIIVTGIQYNSYGTIHFNEPIIFTKGNPKLTARRIKGGMVMIKLWRGRKLICSWTMNYHQLDRKYFGVVLGSSHKYDKEIGDIF